MNGRRSFVAKTQCVKQLTNECIFAVYFLSSLAGLKGILALLPTVKSVGYFLSP